MKRQWVYFIKPIGWRGPIKIGCSVAPDNRRTTLETWCPVPLEVVAEIQGNYALERRFHAAFAEQWIKHEWFHWSEALGAMIDKIRAGEFDIETLPSPASLTQFRKPRDNSIYTEEWRYEASLKARWRHHLSSWPWWDKEFAERFGFSKPLLPHKAEIEELYQRRLAERRKAAA